MLHASVLTGNPQSLRTSDLLKLRYIAATSLMILVTMLASHSFWSGNSRPENSSVSGTHWIALAEKAWEYFQPGKAVDAVTGLHSAGLGWPYFTDWDLGIHIQAIIDAERLGILATDGSWGADERLEKLMQFLEDRELTNESLPYLWYDSRNGGRFGDKATNPWDTGKLLVALENLKLHRPELAERIDHVVYERTNYAPLASRIDGCSSSLSLYVYYCSKGFSYFWPERHAPVAEAVLENIMSAERVETYGVSLPKADITCDPMLHSIFELENDPRMLELAHQVYLAHEARYETTGEYTAFSEGNTDLGDPTYVYEWVLQRDGTTWLVKDHSGKETDIAPIVYLKVALGFSAIYGTDFTDEMVEYILNLLPEPCYGYMDGVDEDERLVKTIIDKTNGLIIEAARYAMNEFDLSCFPYPFLQNRVINNTLVVIGESKPRGPAGAAHTTDTLGGMLITGRLAGESVNGTVKAAIDGWMVSYDPTSGNVTLLDTVSNLIVVGSPGINIVGHYYNCLRNPFGDPLVPVLFATNCTGAYNYLYVPSSESAYRMEFDDQDGLIADYGAIILFKDQFGRYVTMVYGVGAEGTRVACEVLRDYDLWNLHGSAVIVKFYTDIPGEYPNKISIVEVIP